MARQKPPDPPEDDVPAWVMTFSDVITLLMTFFILLLTFATNQPETFDRLQVSMFGGGGATGFAGKSDGMEKDSLLMRERARTGRMATEGSQMPPIYSDPALESLNKGIAGLEDEELRVISTTHRVEQELDKIVDSNGEITARGKQMLRMLAVQMKRRPIQLDLVVAEQQSVPRALSIVEHMTNVERLPHAVVGVGIAPNQTVGQQLLMVVSDKGARRGKED